MSFEVNEKVVYPGHGVAVVSQVAIRTVNGVQREYLKITVESENLTIDIPADKCEIVGIRPISEEDHFDEVFDTLQDEHVEGVKNWKQRHDAANRKIHSADAIKVAEVIRDITHRGIDKKLSFIERGILRKARGNLAAEIAESHDITIEDAQRLIDENLPVDETDFEENAGM